MKFLEGFRRRRRQQDLLADELASHLEELTEELIDAGCNPQEAGQEARRRFGNQTALLESAREVWRFQWVDALMRDVRFSWRLARRQPWTMLAAVASIAVGVGANTAVTSVLNAVLLNPLGIRNADRIVAASVHITKLQMTGAGTSGAEFRDLQSSSDVFSAVAATDGRAWALGGEQPARVVGLAVTPEFFKVFGVELALRDPRSVVVSDSLWTARFGHDSSLVGKKILLDGRPYHVTGIAPPGFHFPANVEAWVLLDLRDYGFQRNMNAVLSLYARLKDEVSVEQAQRRVDHEVLKFARTSEAIELNKLGYGMDLEPLARRVAGDLRLPLLFLWLASAVLLIAACANVAGLLLARAGSRRREMAIRISVGAGRWQLLRQLLTESLILSLLGGAAGLICAAILLGVLKSWSLPYQQMISFAVLDGRLLLYGLGLALLSSFVFGLAPAVQLLREQHAGAMARPRRRWFQNFYIAAR